MLILSRLRDEKIVIGSEGVNQVIVEIVDIRGDKVRVGIHADKAIPVHREEVWKAIQRNKIEAKPMTNGKTKSGLTPDDIDELTAAKATLRKFHPQIVATKWVEDDDLNLLDDALFELENGEAVPQ